MSGQGHIDDSARRLHDFIARTYLKRRTRTLADDEPLLSSGLIDSLGLIDLTVFIEEEFDVLVSPDEFGAGRADTVAEIAGLVAARRGGR